MNCLLRLSVSLSLVSLLAACTVNPHDDPGSTSSTSSPSSTRTQQTDPASPRGRAEAHTALAMGYYERGQLNVALEELDEAKSTDDRYPMIYNGYGLVYSYMKENDKARSNFQRAIQLDPNNPEIRHNWGWFLCTSGQPRESLKEFEFAARDPLYKVPEIALTNAGRCALALNDKATSRQYLLRALNSKPDYSPAAYSLAELNYGENRLEEARVLMRIVMQTALPSPNALFLGACIERKLGDKNAETSYVTQLQNRYPNASQTQQIASPTGCP